MPWLKGDWQGRLGASHFLGTFSAPRECLPASKAKEEGEGLYVHDRLRSLTDNRNRKQTHTALHKPKSKSAQRSHRGDRKGLLNLSRVKGGEKKKPDWATPPNVLCDHPRLANTLILLLEVTQGVPWREDLQI